MRTAIQPWAGHNPGPSLGCCNLRLQLLRPPVPSLNSTAKINLLSPQNMSLMKPTLLTSSNLFSTSALPQVATSHPGMLGLGISLALAAAAAWWIRRFIKADADLHLLGLSPPEPGFYEGKVVWVTGASQGLGLRLARYFSEQGAKLILSARGKERLEKVAASCNGRYSEEIVILPFDMSATHEALSDVANEALAAFEGAGPDYIVHNAGGSQHSLVEDTAPSIVGEMIWLNSVGPIALTQALIPGLLKKKKGHFVVIASMAAVVPAGGQAIYSGSKFALRGYFEALRSEMADSPIKATVCCPGALATGGKDEPRVVFGADGLIDSTKTSSTGKSKKMDLDRAVLLIATATRHNLPECWITNQPILLLAYLLQLSPWLGWKLLEKFGPARARGVKSGDGYSFGKILFGGKKSV